MAPKLSGFLRELKYDIFAAIAEFIGTTLFLLLGLGGVQASITSNLAHQTPEQKQVQVASMQQLLYIATSMGLALLVTAWTFFRVSGSVFNPNVALALLLTGAMKPMRFSLYVCAEILGAIAASGILNAALPGKLGVNCSLHPQISPAQGVAIEALLTAALTLTILLLAVEKHRATPFAPCAIGLVLFATHLFGVIYTGAAMNSARALGPDVITQFSDHHWVYWVGPTIGALAATLLYHFLKAVDLYALTPKQDSEDRNDSPLAGIEISVRRPHSPSLTESSLEKAQGRHGNTHPPMDILAANYMPNESYAGSIHPHQTVPHLMHSQSRRDRNDYDHSSGVGSLYHEKGAEPFANGKRE